MADARRLRDLDESRWHGALREASPPRDHDFTPGAVQVLCQHGVPGLAGVVSALASDNDVRSLQRFLDEPLFLQGLAASHQRSAITYAVAHMLVDGGGNEVFARHWLQALGHDQALATKVLRSELPAALVEARVQDLQRLLGLSTLIPDPFDAAPGDIEAPPLDALVKSSAQGKPAEIDAFLIGEFLLARGASRLPEVIDVTIEIEAQPRIGQMVYGHHKRMPLAQAMWTNTHETARFLPFVAQWFPASDATHREQMHQGFASAVKEGQLPIALHPRLTRLITQAIEQQDLDADSLSSLWLASFREWRFTKNHESTIHNVSFPQAVLACARADEQACLQFLSVLHHRGMDLTRRIIERLGEGKRSRGLLDVAIQAGSPCLFGLLLSWGADPCRPGWTQEGCEARRPAPSPQQRIESLLREHESEDPQKPAIAALVQMRDAITAWKARRAADDALAQLLPAP